MQKPRLGCDTSYGFVVRWFFKKLSSPQNKVTVATKYADHVSEALEGGDVQRTLFRTEKLATTNKDGQIPLSNQYHVTACVRQILVHKSFDLRNLALGFWMSFRRSRKVFCQGNIQRREKYLFEAIERE